MRRAHMLGHGGPSVWLHGLLGAVALLWGLGLMPAQALTLEEQLLPPAQEAMAEQLFNELRCAVCQGQSVKDSNAKLAIDLRQAVRSELKAGKTPQAIRTQLVERYGPQILLQERSARLTPLYLLVGSIFALLLLAGLRHWKQLGQKQSERAA